MTKEYLQSNLEKVNQMISFNSGLVEEFKSILINSIALMKDINTEEQGPILQAWLPMALDEMEREFLKFSDDFHMLPPDRAKSEFLYSKSAVSLALTNVIINM